LQDVKLRIGVGEAHQSALGDEDIAGLGHLGGVRPLVDDFFWRRRHEIANLFRLERVADVMNTQVGVAIGSEELLFVWPPALIGPRKPMSLGLNPGEFIALSGR
jgi:hypothetical protein